MFRGIGIPFVCCLDFACHTFRKPGTGLKDSLLTYIFVINKKYMVLITKVKKVQK